MTDTYDQGQDDEPEKARWNVSEWHGRTIIDSYGEKIGKLQDVYVDVETDEPQFATVKEGFIDRHLTFVGSMNLDFRSSRVNTELGMLVESRELAQEVLRLSEFVKSVGSFHLRLGPDGKQVQWVGNDEDQETVYDEEPGVGIGTMLEVWLLSPFISENLL